MVHAMLRSYFLDQSLALNDHTLAKLCRLRVSSTTHQVLYKEYSESVSTIQAIQSSLAQLVARSAVTRLRHISDVKLHSIPEG
jgi:hypothetical protein